MVQLQHWGDKYDYFKYDLITSLVTRIPFKQYVFVPMLTEPRKSSEGKKDPQYIEGKNPKLLEFIKKHKIQPSLQYWEQWLCEYVKLNSSGYHTLGNPDEKIFKHETRNQYWEDFTYLLEKENALIFLDPDTGLQTGSERYREKQGKEKYLLNCELKYLVNSLASTSALLLYQHLTRNKKYYGIGFKKKIGQIEQNCKNTFINAYREGNLAFIVVSTSDILRQKIERVLNEYNRQSGCLDKSIYPFGLHTHELRS